MVGLNLPLLIVMSLNIIASFGLLTLLTWKAEGRFKEKALYLSYIVGLGSGVAGGLLYAFVLLYFLRRPELFNIPSLVLMTLLLSLVDVLFLVTFARFSIVRKERGREFIVMALGLGTSAMLSAYLSFQALADSLSVLNLASSILLILMNTYAVGTAGVLVGGIAEKGEKLTAFWKPLLLLLPMNAIILLAYIFFLWEGYLAGALFYALIGGIVFHRLLVPKASGG